MVSGHRPVMGATSSCTGLHLPWRVVPSQQHTQCRKSTHTLSACTHSAAAGRTVAMDGSKVPRHRLYGEAGKAAAGLTMQLRPYLSAGNPCPHLTGGTRATSGLCCSSSQCLKGQANPPIAIVSWAHSPTWQWRAAQCMQGSAGQLFAHCSASQPAKAPHAAPCRSHAPSWLMVQS